jgi:ATP-dependent Clp protease ATP-binding subunit ClpA
MLNVVASSSIRAEDMVFHSLFIGATGAGKTNALLYCRRANQGQEGRVLRLDLPAWRQPRNTSRLAGTEPGGMSHNR